MGTLRDYNVNNDKVTAVIPALNEDVNINRAIDSARDQDAEIIVVDGGSKDRTVSRAMGAGTRVIRSFRGRALQQNIGAGASSGNVLLFVHADTILPEGYIGHIFETLMDSRVVTGAFHFSTDFKHPFMKLIEEVANIRARFLQLPYGDQAIFLRRSTFESAGGFPLVPIAEDLFFTRKLKKTGKIRIAPALAVTSARRWRELGLIRTTWINYKIMAGCLLGVSPEKLVRLYRRR